MLNLRISLLNNLRDGLVTTKKVVVPFVGRRDRSVLKQSGTGYVKTATSPPTSLLDLFNIRLNWVVATKLLNIITILV